MINGVSISEMQSVNQTKNNHYRRISQVQQSNYSRFSIIDPQLSKIMNQKKNNHEKWKKFQFSRFTTELEKGNEVYKRKIERIKMGKSIYTIDKKNSPMHSKASNFYNRKKNLELIQSLNPVIARKIIKARGTVQQVNNSHQYTRYRDAVHRLERFSSFQRMASFSQRKSRVKTDGDSFFQEKRLSPLSPSISKKLDNFKKSYIQLKKV